MTLPGMDNDIYFGEVGEPSSWDPVLDNEDPDDEELDETPEDVIGVLGFDPKDEGDSSPVKNEFEAGDENDGHWVTMAGAHIYIQGGMITKGPEGFVGKKPSEVSDKPDKKVGATTESYFDAKVKDGEPDKVWANVKTQEDWEKVVKGDETTTKAFKGWGRGTACHNFRLCAIGKGPNNPKVQANFVAFSHALRAAPTWEGTAYRGSSISQGLADTIKEGGTVVLKGPTSLTYDKGLGSIAALSNLNSATKGTVPAFFEVQMKHGADIHNLTGKLDESEVVNKGPARYRVVGVEKIAAPKDTGDENTVTGKPLGPWDKEREQRWPINTPYMLHVKLEEMDA